MTGYPERTGSSSFDITDALQAAGITMGPVEPRRRLLSDAVSDRAVEFFSSRVGGRLLAMPSNSPDSNLHIALAEAGLPMLPRETYPPEGLQLLHVPVGTNSLQSRLHLLRRNVGQYGSLFTDMVQSQRLQFDAGLGVLAPGEEPLISRFAVIDDRSTESGLKPYLLPPYDTNPAGTPEEFAAQLTQELAETELFTELQMEQLGALIQGAAGGPTT